MNIFLEYLCINNFIESDDVSPPSPHGVMSQLDLTQQLHILTQILKIQNMIRRTMNL